MIFNTKTTSSATDLFYQYDSLKHFQYIQNHNRELTDDEVEKRFIKYQALGEAIKRNKYLGKLADIQKKQFLVIQQHQGLINREIGNVEIEKQSKMVVLSEKQKDK